MRLAEWFQTVIAREGFFSLSLTPMIDFLLAYFSFLIVGFWQCSHFDCRRPPYCDDNTVFLVTSLRSVTSTLPWRPIQPVCIKRGNSRFLSFRKHAYSNILKILQPKKENFQIKNSDIFQISAQNIDCGYLLEPPQRGGSNEYPQSMFFSKIRKIMYTPVNPSFAI